jgi:sirohydrochlorin cobaltochelatase
MTDTKAGRPAILVVSFGTTYPDRLEAGIGAIEAAVRDAFPDRDVRRAFTSQMVLEKLRRRDGTLLDNVPQAMERLLADGVSDLTVQPTHVMNGREYDKMMAALAPYRARFNAFRVGAPLLSRAADLKQLVSELSPELPPPEPGAAVVMMGHGSDHFADAAYAALDYVFKDMGRADVFIGTVEGYPDLDTALRHVTDFGANRVTLMPLMIVAGDHAENDMAGDGRTAGRRPSSGRAARGVRAPGAGRVPRRARSTSSATSGTRFPARGTGMIRAAKMAADGGKGMLSFVGVGPGDPELVTLKAVRALEAADLIALPDSGAGEGAAEKIAEAWIRGKEKLRLPMPMCGERGDWRAAHRQAAEALMARLREGARIAYRAGDPLLYATSGYLLALIGPRTNARSSPRAALCAMAAAFKCRWRRAGRR